MRRRPAVAAAALAALMFGAACAVVTTLLAGRLLAGRPATSPLELLQPETPLLVPGRALPLPWGESLPVTAELVTAVAATQLILFSGATVLWLAAGTGLLRMRRWGRHLALVLFIGTGALGLWNLFIGMLLVVFEGRVALAVMAGPLAVILVLLVALPGILATLLLQPAVARAFHEADSSPARPVLITGLVLHYGLVAVLLAAAAAAPASLGEPRLLLGPWLISGLAARWGTAAVALLHGVAARACWQQRRSAYVLSLGLNGGLTLLALWSVFTARSQVLDLLGAGLLPAATVRGLLVVATLVGGSVVATVWAGRRTLTAVGVPSR